MGRLQTNAPHSHWQAKKKIEISGIWNTHDVSNPYQSGTYIYLWGGRGGESQGSLRQVHYTIVFLNETSG